LYKASEGEAFTQDKKHCCWISQFNYVCVSQGDQGYAVENCSISRLFDKMYVIRVEVMRNALSLAKFD